MKTVRDERRKAEKNERHERRKLEIANVALSLIAKKGVDDVSLRSVAKESSYHPASLYEYFESKSDLLTYVSNLAREKFMTYLNKVLVNQDNVEQKLYELAMVYLEYAKNEPEYFHVMFISLKQDWTKIDPLSDESPIKFLVETVQHGIESKKIKVKQDMGAFEIAYHLWSLVHGIATLQQTFFVDYPYDWETVHQKIIKDSIASYFG